jgi:hypothetical protein
MFSRTTAAIIAIMSCASNETFARSAGAGGATAHGVVGLGAPRSINRGVGPGLGWSRFPAIRARNLALRRGLRFRRTWFPGVWPDDCFSYGSCYQVPGGAEPYENDVTSSGPPPAVIVLRPLLPVATGEITWSPRKTAVSEASRLYGAFRWPVFHRPGWEIRQFARSLATTGLYDDIFERRPSR